MDLRYQNRRLEVKEVGKKLMHQKKLSMNLLWYMLGWSLKESPNKSPLNIPSLGQL